MDLLFFFLSDSPFSLLDFPNCIWGNLHGVAAKVLDYGL